MEVVDEGEVPRVCSVDFLQSERVCMSMIRIITISMVSVS